jgi:4-amino-4-deoxy-L-arabinose transferase-like glycosyltransferase
MELRGFGDAGVARPITLARPVLAAAALTALTVVRLMAAAAIPLSPDEAYYRVWSRALAAGYLDHPPMVALWIRLGTIFAGPSAFGIRLLAPFAAAVGSLLLWRAAEMLIPRRGAGLIAAALLNATLVLGAGAVTMTPDTPLLFFWVCALWAMAHVLRGDTPAWWLAVGASTGLALDSKYTAAFLIVGIALWLLFAGRQWLARPWPWLGAAVGLAITMPVLWWNAAHGWASFVKQGGRIDNPQFHRAARFLLELIGGQLGLATPLVLALSIAGVARATWRAWHTRDPVATLLVALTLPPSLVFIEHALGDRVQGNWPAIIYPAAVIAAATLEASRWRRLYWPASLLGLGITLAVYLHAALGLLPIPIRLDPSALQLDGWPQLATSVDEQRRRFGADFVVADQYGAASELAYWLPANVPSVALGARWRLFDLPKARVAGQTGLLVRSTRRGAMTGNDGWLDVEPIGTVDRTRNGETIETYRLYRVTSPVASSELAALPPVIGR